MYSLYESVITIDKTSHKIYGIKCGEVSVNDISPNRTTVLGLVETYNRCNLDPIHLHDAVSDFIALM